MSADNAIEPWLRDLLRCPTCHGELADAPGQLTCATCRVGYRVDDGIPVLLADDAVPLVD